MGLIECSDGCRMYYNKNGHAGDVLVMIHGWTGSGKYFVRNVPELSESCQVYTLDLRFHGLSDKPLWGAHVARLAADLRNFLDALDLQRVTVVGTSLGAAVIWSYVELFGTQRLARAVFVDQAPLQNRLPDWPLGSKGCFDEPSLRALQADLLADEAAFHQATAAACATKTLPPDVAHLLQEESLLCDARQAAALMGDHTQLDWRPILPRLDIPCLNLIGGCSSVFPVEGCAFIGTAAPNCTSVVFEDCNHWLHLEDPDRFNKELTKFI